MGGAGRRTRTAVGERSQSEKPALRTMATLPSSGRGKPMNRQSTDGSGGRETPREPTVMDTCLLLLPKPIGSTTPRVSPWRLWALGREDESLEGHPW